MVKQCVNRIREKGELFQSPGVAAALMFNFCLISSFLPPENSNLASSTSRRALDLYISLTMAFTRPSFLLYTYTCDSILPNRASELTERGSPLSDRGV